MVCRVGAVVVVVVAREVEVVLPLVVARVRVSVWALVRPLVVREESSWEVTRVREKVMVWRVVWVTVKVVVPVPEGAERLVVVLAERTEVAVKSALVTPVMVVAVPLTVVLPDLDPLGATPARVVETEVVTVVGAEIVVVVPAAVATFVVVVSEMSVS